MTPMEKRQMHRIRRTFKELTLRIADAHELMNEIESENWQDGWRDLCQEFHLMGGCVQMLSDLSVNTIRELPEKRVYPPDEYRNV